jgi:hypothetical protein
MWSEKGKNFDPLLLKCFINMMGIYPIGTIVELDSGETGLVMGYPDETEKARPLVMLLVDDGKETLAQGEMINLAEKGINEGQPRRSIVRGIPLSRIGIQPSHYFLQTGEDFEGSSPQESI